MKKILEVTLTDLERQQEYNYTIGQNEEGEFNTFVKIVSDVSVSISEKSILEIEDIPEKIDLSANNYTDDADDYEYILSRDEFLMMLNAFHLDRGASFLHQFLNVDYSSAKNFLIEYRKGN